MKTASAIFAVAALAATAFSFEAQNAAYAYCRGCVEAGVAGGIAGAAAMQVLGPAAAQANAQNAASAVTPTPGVAPADVADPAQAYGSAVCTNKPRVNRDGSRTWSTDQVCE